MLSRILADSVIFESGRLFGFSAWTESLRCPPRQPPFPARGGKGKVLTRRTHSPDRTTAFAGGGMLMIIVIIEIE